MSKYEADYFRAGAADTLNKAYDEVTNQERVRFKVAVFHVLTSNRFKAGQSDYLRQAFERTEADQDFMGHMLEWVCCLECGGEVDPAQSDSTKYTFWCPVCDEDLVLSVNDCVDILKGTKIMKH